MYGWMDVYVFMYVRTRYACKAPMYVRRMVVLYMHENMYCMYVCVYVRGMSVWPMYVCTTYVPKYEGIYKCMAYVCIYVLTYLCTYVYPPSYPHPPSTYIHLTYPPHLSTLLPTHIPPHPLALALHFEFTSLHTSHFPRPRIADFDETRSQVMSCQVKSAQVCYISNSYLYLVFPLAAGRYVCMYVAIEQDQDPWVERWKL